MGEENQEGEIQEMDPKTDRNRDAEKHRAERTQCRHTAKGRRRDRARTTERQGPGEKIGSYGQ